MSERTISVELHAMPGFYTVDDIQEHNFCFQIYSSGGFYRPTRNIKYRNDTFYICWESRF